MEASDTDLLDAAAVLSRTGLVTAFGHVSVRATDSFKITPGKPLGELASARELREMALSDSPTATEVPGEAWLHWAIYRARPDVAAICRAQPPSVDLASALRARIIPHHGQGALLGPEVARHDDPRLIRSADAGVKLAGCLGDAAAVVMRGNGAVTTGPTVAHAVAKMWILERSARIAAAAASSPTSVPLGQDEIAAWTAVKDELLNRIWAHLRQASFAAK